MTREVEPHMPDEPATHKKRSQYVVLAIAGVLAFVMIVDIIINAGSDEPAAVEETVVVQEPTQTSGESASLSDFNRQFARASEQDRPAASISRPEPVLNLSDEPAQISRDIDRRRSLAQGLPLDNKPFVPANQLPNDTRNTQSSVQYSQGQLPQNLSSVDPEYQAWLAAEQNRARASLQSRFNLNLREPISREAQQNDAAIDQELTEIRSLREQIQSRIAAELNDQPANNADANNQALASNTVGQASSTTSGIPKPGQKVLPVTTVMRAVLDQKIVSDYPGGPWRGMIVEDIYDRSGNYILIPKGSRVEGNTLLITNVNAPIQARMAMTTRSIVLPNGERISLARSASNILDREGISALEDEVDYHFLAQFFGVAAFALISSGTARNDTGDNGERSFEGDVGDTTRSQFGSLAAKYLTLVPTITLNPGLPMRIYLEEELFVTPWASVTDSLIPSF